MIVVRMLLAVALCCIAVKSQTREAIENRIAQLPPDQRTYERYRYWVTTQPVTVQRSPDVIRNIASI
jgi:hypothetical protein